MAYRYIITNGGEFYVGKSQEVVAVYNWEGSDVVMEGFLEEVTFEMEKRVLLRQTEERVFPQVGIRQPKWLGPTMGGGVTKVKAGGRKD